MKRERPTETIQKALRAGCVSVSDYALYVNAQKLAPAHCSECIDRYGIDVKTRSPRVYRITRCVGCDKVRFCIIGPKRIVDMKKFMRFIGIGYVG